MKDKIKVDKIRKLKKKLKAVILAHNYQPPQIQDIADFTGDSLGLSREASSTEAEVIVFCGVDFMAETAKILSPEKTVLNPQPHATCPMAEMITVDELEEFKKEYPDALTLSYVNTTAEVKAHSDLCCTSSNAVKIVNALDEEKVIFTPDRNLAAYVSSKTEKEIIPWNGFCPVHDSISPERVKEIMKKYPRAPLMAHPECRREVLALADYVTSTSGMFSVPQKEDSKEFIVGTEEGIIYPLNKKFPRRKFIPAGDSVICPNMKKISLEKIIDTMENLKNRVRLSPDVIKNASAALKRMLRLS